MEEDGRPGSWYIAAAQQGQICSVVISLPSATTARKDLQCSAPARHSEDLPPKHSETQLPERLQNGCRITAPAYAHRDSIGLATALATPTATHRIPDLAIPRCAIAATAHARGARGISRASFSTAGARVPRAERRCNGDAVCGRARGTVLRPAPRVDRAPSGPRLP
jgi:hypothetical protein